MTLKWQMRAQVGWRLDMVFRRWLRRWLLLESQEGGINDRLVVDSQRLGTAVAGAPFMHIGHGAGPGRVFHLQIRQIEAGQTDKFIYLLVQMAASSHAAPGRSDPVLPTFNGWLGRKSMLDKAESAIRFEYPPHLAQRGQRLRKRAKIPGHHDGIDSVVRKSNRCCRAQMKFNRHP